MFNVEFIGFTDWQPDAQVVHRLPNDFRTFDEAIEAGNLQNNGVFGVGFRVVEADAQSRRPARVVAHRFRGL